MSLLNMIILCLFVSLFDICFTFQSTSIVMLLIPPPLNLAFMKTGVTLKYLAIYINGRTYQTGLHVAKHYVLSGIVPIHSHCLILYF